MPTRGSSLERVSAASRARADLELVSLDTHSGGVDDEQLLPPPPTPLQRLVARFVTTNNAVAASWVVNIFLLAAKIAAFISTNSKAVLASLADSAVDLCSQMILSLADRYVKRHDARYPVGRARLEALGVLGCACIMSMAAVEVVQYSVIDLVAGLRGHPQRIEVTPTLYVVLSVGTAAKVALYLLCRAARAAKASDTLGALAEDHLNDVWSNTATIFSAVMAAKVRGAWWVDPAGGIAISALIIARWAAVTWEQTKKLTGHTAPPEFVARVNKLAAEHSAYLAVDVTRCYHFGSRFNVEMEIVLPADMTVAESHDIALALQHKIEGQIDVERAFVHVDYLQRDGLEHKVERELNAGLAVPEPPVPALQQRVGRSARGAASEA